MDVHCLDIICILVGVSQQFAVTTMVTLVSFMTYRCKTIKPNLLFRISKCQNTRNTEVYYGFLLICSIAQARFILDVYNIPSVTRWEGLPTV